MADAPREWIEHGVAHVEGFEVPQPFVMRFVQEDDLDRLYKLHLAVVSALHHPHAFRLDSRAFMEQQIERRGRTVGVFCAGDLVAYAAISFPDGDPDNLGRDLPLPASELGKVANYDGSAVHPLYRGNQFQRRMTDVRHRCALLHGRNHILGTVSPFNPVSLQNFLALGCRVKGLKTKYGGMLRLIIHRDLLEPQPQALDPGSFIDVPLSDADAHVRLTRTGFQGLRVVAGSGEPCLRYGLPYGEPEEKEASAWNVLAPLPTDIRRVAGGGS